MVLLCPDGWACGLPDPGEEVEDRHRFLQGTQERKLSQQLEGNRGFRPEEEMSRHPYLPAPWRGCRAMQTQLEGMQAVPGEVTAESGQGCSGGSGGRPPG